MARNTPPNIILILSDQHRWDCTGYAGNPDVRTPNLDALATHGVTFTEATCTSPLCVPSRASLMTGQHVHAHGVDTNDKALSKDAPVLPRLLKQAGYRTACVGKMHFRPTRQDHGFDFMRLAEQDTPGRDEDDYHKWLADRGEKDQTDIWDQVDREHAPATYWRSLGAVRSRLPQKLHSTTWIGDNAVRFLQRAVEPFFLWIGFMKPHHPFDPPEPWDALYDPKKLALPPGWRLPVPEDDAAHGGFFDPAAITEARFRKVLAYYYANISLMDKQIGRILATLTSRGFTNNIIVYCSDHGDYMGQHGLITKAGLRPYDSVLRVPLVIAGLSGQRRGQTDGALAQISDIAPTLLDVAGVDAPAAMDGASLVPHLNVANRPLRDAVFAQDGPGVHVVRTRHHKLVQSSEPARSALYCIDKDPHEFENRYEDESLRQVKAGLDAQLRAFLGKRT